MIAATTTKEEAYSSINININPMNLYFIVMTT